jgi:CHAT domain-containing protein/tetratricopeptide (TPR) repeat protein
MRPARDLPCSANLSARRARRIALAAALVAIVAGLPCASFARAGSAPIDSVRVLLDRDDERGAEAFARATYDTALARPGPDSLGLAEAGDALVEALSYGNESTDAGWIRIARQGLRIKQRTLGRDAPGTATSMLVLARLLRNSQEYAEALPLIRAALQIRVRHQGQWAMETGHARNALADLLGDMGLLAESHAQSDSALAVYRHNQGGKSPDIAQALNNLGVTERHEGDFAGARQCLEEALAMRLELLPPDHTDITESVNNLANILEELAEYAQARRLYEEALARWRKVLNPNHPNLAAGFNNLGTLMRDMGDYADARPMFEQAVRIWEQKKPGSSDHIEAVCNLGTVLAAQGDLVAARRTFEHAAALAESAQGASPADLAGARCGLAGVLDEAGDHEGAARANEQAASLYSEMFGPDHPVVAAVLMDIAATQRLLGRTDSAFAYYHRVLEIERATVGDEHPKVTEALVGIAATQLQAGQWVAAFDTSLIAERASREHLRLTIGTLPEREALRYRAVNVSGLDAALSALVAAPRIPDGVARAWDALVRSRTLVLDEMARRHRDVETSRDPRVVRLRRELARARERLAQMVVRDPTQDKFPRVTRIREMRREAEALERRLARIGVDASAGRARESFGLATVAAAMPAGSALVAFARYKHANEHDGGATGARYLAFVLGPGARRPSVIGLGNAGPMDSLIQAWRAEVGRAPVPGAEQAYRRVGEALRLRAWDPIARHLAGANQVFIVPDGALNLVSFATLPVAGSQYLVETGPLLHYLSSERDLARPPAGSPPGPTLLAVGEADFDHAGPEDRTATVAGSTAAAAVRSGEYRGATSTCQDFASMRFDSLPSTGGEVRDIVDAWRSGVGSVPGRSARAVQLLGVDATERAFKRSAAGQAVIHLATHGFFVGDACVRARRAGDAARATSADAGENPLLLSGLALAGANQRGHARLGEDDGIVTAEEIASLDLSRTQWAVLSACETGLGSVTSGEGVLGLRRAFQVAGARTVIMSLWKVGDLPTRRWMRALYAAHFDARRLSTAEAIREASRKLLKDARENGESTHPAPWGAFIASGDWR